jgi:hypothetical protein
VSLGTQLMASRKIVVPPSSVSYAMSTGPNTSRVFALFLYP